MTELPQEVKDYMRLIGSKAGKASAAKLTKEQRQERARKAGSAPKKKRSNWYTT